MNTITKIFASITLILLLLSGYTYFTSQDSVKNIQSNTTQLTTVEGSKYLEYCGGGLSDQVVANDSTSCIADYPGVFAAAGLTYITIFMLIITGIIAGISQVIGARKDKQT